MTDAQIVEAILFASDAPLSPGEIARADEALDEDRVESALSLLRAEYEDGERAFELKEVADGYQLMTRPEFAPYLERFDTVPRPSRLSGPALEALAIVAYRQPISRIEVEFVRGVNSAGVMRTLQEHELVEVVGRGEGIGRPVLYGTTSRFLEHFGLPSIDALPRPEELPVVLRERVTLDVLAEAEPQEDTTRDGSQLELDQAVDVVLRGLPTGPDKDMETDDGRTDFPIQNGDGSPVERDGSLPVAEA
ncbi:MAG: SMC-Scp complex subunit ScpB [Gemmatimonadetes bacterium]|nr:SMC-Scp complex subunit ScpB [Gemmatimonadota bacterium]